jgi:hypothetical protein
LFGGSNQIGMRSFGDRKVERSAPLTTEGDDMRSGIFAAAAGSVALFFASTASTAAPTAAAQMQAPNAWLTLSALSSTHTAAVAGTNLAAQPAEVPPPPPAVTESPAINGEIIGFVVWFALIAIALGISDSGGRPNSPA